MFTTFDKNIYTPQETAHAKVCVDHGNCKLPVEHVRFFVEQRLKIGGGGWDHEHSIHKKLVESKVKGPSPGDKDFHEDLNMDLSKIKFEVSGEKKKKGQNKKLSPEDVWLMAGIQPACHSKNIKNEYFICVELDFKGCTCCSDVPDVKTPLTIVPLVNPECFGFKPPGGYAPKELGSFDVKLNFHY